MIELRAEGGDFIFETRRSACMLAIERKEDVAYSHTETGWPKYREIVHPDEAFIELQCNFPGHLEQLRIEVDKLAKRLQTAEKSLSRDLDWYKKYLEGKEILES